MGHSTRVANFGENIALKGYGVGCQPPNLDGGWRLREGLPGKAIEGGPDEWRLYQSRL